MRRVLNSVFKCRGAEVQDNDNGNMYIYRAAVCINAPGIDPPPLPASQARVELAVERTAHARTCRLLLEEQERVSELLDAVSPSQAARMRRGSSGDEEEGAVRQLATADAELEAGVAQLSLGEEAAEAQAASPAPASATKPAASASPAPELSSQKSVESHKLAVEGR